MRGTLRLLASVKPGRYLEPGHPTGLTGLFNHPAPRSTLLYLYGSTLDKLKAFPEYSVYRQSTEAITKHRMHIIQSIKPKGYEEWAKKATETMEKYPEAFQPGGQYEIRKVGGLPYVMARKSREGNDEDEEFTSSERPVSPANSLERKASDGKISLEGGRDIVHWEPEPPLEASQIEDAEAQIGAGLIEEVIEVAEGELKLLDTMMESKVWEELEDKPLPGQWDYFSRDQHQPGTQEPPTK